MLVLSRVVGEMISIGDNISVRILAVNGGSVRFGVEAPQNVNVHRAEVAVANEKTEVIDAQTSVSNSYLHLSELLGRDTDPDRRAVERRDGAGRPRGVRRAAVD